MHVLPYLTAAYVFVVGCYGLATSRNLIHAVGCLAVCQSATYVLLLAVGYRDGGTAPVFSDLRPGSRPVADPRRAGAHPHRHRGRRDRDRAAARPRGADLQAARHGDPDELRELRG